MTRSRLWVFSTGQLGSVEALLDRSGALRRTSLSITCALLETETRLVLVDTGFGLRTARSPRSYPGLRFCTVMPVHLKREETCVGRLEALGLSPSDITDIVLTHLHLDHAGAIEDFPNARIHVTADELTLASKPRWPLPTPGYDHRAYRHGPLWSVFALDHKPAHGFSRSLDLFGDGSVVALGAEGHSRGHVAVALRVADRTLIHAGDAYLREAELDTASNPRRALGAPMRLFRWVVVDDAERERDTICRLAALRTREDIVLVNSHDPVYLERLPAFPNPAFESSG